VGVTALPCDTVAHGDVAGSAPGPGSRIALPGGGVLNRLPGRGDLLAWTVDDGADSEVVRLYTQFAKDAGMRLTYFVTGSLHSWTDNADLLRPLVAADLGYQVVTLWSGDLRDSALLTEDEIIRTAYQCFTPQSIVIGHLNHRPVTRVYGQLVQIIRARALRTVTLNDVFLRPPAPQRKPAPVGRGGGFSRAGRRSPWPPWQGRRPPRRAASRRAGSRVPRR